MKAYVWTTHESGCSVMVFAETEEKAKEIVARRYPNNPYAEELLKRKPMVHEDLELIYVFGNYKV